MTDTRAREARTNVRSAQQLLLKLGALLLREMPYHGESQRLEMSTLYNRLRERLASADLLLKPRKKP